MILVEHDMIELNYRQQLVEQLERFTLDILFDSLLGCACPPVRELKDFRQGAVTRKTTWALSSCHALRRNTQWVTKAGSASGQRRAVRDYHLSPEDIN